MCAHVQCRVSKPLTLKYFPRNGDAFTQMASHSVGVSLEQQHAFCMEAGRG